MLLKGPIAKGTIRTSFVLGLRVLIQAGTLLIVARMLGPDQFGTFAGVAALAVMLGTLSTFGTHIVLLGEISKEPARRDEVLQWAIPTTLICGGALLGIYLLLCELALQVAAIPVSALVMIGATETLLQPLFSLPTAEHLAGGRIARSQLLQNVPLVLRLIAAVTVFLAFPADPLTAYGYGYFAASIIALCVASATMPARWPSPQHWRVPRWRELKDAFGYAVISITTTSPVEIDKALATRLLPLTTAGLYSAGARVIASVILPVVAMLLSALPRLFREGHSQPKQTARLLRWLYLATLGYSMLAIVLLWYISPALMWLFGAQYQGIQEMLLWLLPAVPGMALRVASGNVLMALGQPWMRVGFEVAGIFVLAIAAAILASQPGLHGMPLALACSEWTMAFVGLFLIRHTMRRSRAHGAILTSLEIRDGTHPTHQDAKQAE